MPPAARGDAASGIAAARQVGSAALANTVRSAHVQAVDVMLSVCRIALATAVLALAFLPRKMAAAQSGDGKVRMADDIGV